MVEWNKTEWHRQYACVTSSLFRFVGFTWWFVAGRKQRRRCDWCVVGDRSCARHCVGNGTIGCSQTKKGLPTSLKNKLCFYFFVNFLFMSACLHLKYLILFCEASAIKSFLFYTIASEHRRHCSVLSITNHCHQLFLETQSHHESKHNDSM